MGGMGTDADLMHKASGQVDEIRGNIENVVKQLSGNIEPVLAQWQGAASNSFRSLMQQFEKEAQDINKALGDISDNIRGSGQDYARNEEEQSGEMSKIQNALGG